MSAKGKQQDSETSTEMERRESKERRARRDIAYQYEITLDPKPERRAPKERRKHPKSAAKPSLRTVGKSGSARKR